MQYKSPDSRQDFKVFSFSWFDYFFYKLSETPSAIVFQAYKYHVFIKTITKTLMKEVKDHKKSCTPTENRLPTFF